MAKVLVTYTIVAQFNCVFFASPSRLYSIATAWRLHFTLSFKKMDGMNWILLSRRFYFSKVSRSESFGKLKCWRHLNLQNIELSFKWEIATLNAESEITVLFVGLLLTEVKSFSWNLLLANGRNLERLIFMDQSDGEWAMETKKESIKIFKILRSCVKSKQDGRLLEISRLFLIAIDPLNAWVCFFGAS